ncbi:MAG: hypothetical protein ACLRZH_10140 [Ruthenibacterium lactatiformans]
MKTISPRSLFSQVKHMVVNLTAVLPPPAGRVGAHHLSAGDDVAVTPPATSGSRPRA